MIPTARSDRSPTRSYPDVLAAAGPGTEGESQQARTQHRAERHCQGEADKSQSYCLAHRRSPQRLASLRAARFSLSRTGLASLMSWVEPAMRSRDSPTADFA